MILNSDKKVICIREIPSNVIEEAIFILKENVIENECESEEDNEEYQIKSISLKKEIIYIIGILTLLAICIFKVI